MGRTKSNLLNQLVKQIGVKFNNCKFKGEHKDSRNQQNSEDWMLNQQVFSQIMNLWGGGCKDDLFVSLLNHQLPQYTSWK